MKNSSLVNSIKGIVVGGKFYPKEELLKIQEDGKKEVNKAAEQEK